MAWMLQTVPRTRRGDVLRPLVLATLTACAGSSSPPIDARVTDVAAPDATTDGTRPDVADAAVEVAAPAIRQAPTQTSYATTRGAIHMTCQGRGALPVVLLAGGADRGSVWNSVVTALGPDVLTCRFDRPGVATSYRPSGPLTPAVVAEALFETLRLAAGELGPRVLLVGHSLGGLHVRLFGATHADMIAGAVLFDPTVPSVAADVARGELQGLGYDPDATAMQGEGVTAWSSNPPLAVLSHDPELAVRTGLLSSADQARWSAGQRSYARLSTRGTQADVANATHYVFQSNTDEAVAAIRAALAAVR